MRPDAYTKAVLTVIAGCLLWLCAMSAGRPLSAQQPMQLGGTTVQPVVVVGWGTFDEHGRASVSMIEGRNGRQSDPNLPIKVVALPPGPMRVTMPYTRSVAHAGWHHQDQARRRMGAYPQRCRARADTPEARRPLARRLRLVSTGRPAGQILVEPADDVLQALDAVPGAATA